MKFASLLLTGLSLGSIYALVALGLVVLYKATEVLNFAHGTFVVLGAYVTARTHETLGFVGAVVAGIAVAAVTALVVERLLITPIRDAPVISLAIMTIGVDIIVSTDLTRRMGPDILNLGHPWGGQAAHFGGVAVATNRIVAIIVAGLVIGALFAAFRFTPWGLAMRAAAEDRETAELMGIRLSWIGMSAWLVAGALAAVAGLFLTGAPTPGLSAGAAAVVLRAFPAAILGGLDSTTGALVGGLLIGVTETLAAGYQDQLSFLGRGFGDVLPYVVMIGVLLVRPHGLFGTKELARA